MFDVIMAADLYLANRPMFDNLVSPNLTPDQVREVLDVVADRALDGAVKVLKRTLKDDIADDQVRHVAKYLLNLADIMDAFAAHKSSESWAGRVARMPLADGRSLKVTITDAKR